VGVMRASLEVYMWYEGCKIAQECNIRNFIRFT